MARPLAEEHGEDAIFADRFVQRGDQVLFGNGALLEVLFHQLVFAFGDELHQRFVARPWRRPRAGREFPRSFAAAIAAGRVGVCLHGDQIDHAVKSLRIGRWATGRERSCGPSAHVRSSISALNPPPPPALGWSI